MSWNLFNGGVSEGGDVLKRSGFGGSCGNNNVVFYGIVFFKGFDELSDGGMFLVNGDVDVVEFFGFVVIIVLVFLVEDGVKSDGSFVGLMVIND